MFSPGSSAVHDPDRDAAQTPRYHDDDHDSSSGFELLDLNSASPKARRFPRLKTKMSYQPLTSKDPDDDKRYGSVDATPAHSPTALLAGGDELQDFEKAHLSNPFLDPETAAYWRGVYENCDYECRHAFDPKLTWSAKEEQALVRKLDLKVCLWAVRLRSCKTG